jgi:predicted permease
MLLLGAVLMVLLIAATNVASLLLARGVQRRREMAVRTALGATRWDTLRLTLVESFVLTTVSVVLGIALAAGGVKTIGTLASTRMPQLDGLTIDWRVLAFALVLSAVVAVVCGAVPAWRSAHVNPQDALRGGRGGGTDRAHHRALRSLVVLEIALSLVLLIGAGLVLKGFATLMSNDPGFDPDRMLTLRITTSALRYPDQTAVRGFVLPAIEAIEAVPGVEAAGAISAVPYVQWGNNSNVRYEGQPGNDPTRLPIVEQRRITPSFFAVTKQRLLAGRLLDDGDDGRPESPPVVVVNEALAKRDFPGRDPIGQRFHLSDTVFATIVGMVSDIRNVGPISPARPEMYWSYLQTAPGTANVSVMLRVRGSDAHSVVPEVRAAVRGVDATAAVDNVATMDEVIARSLGRPRFYFSLLGTFAGIAIVLAVAGLYGVLSYSIEQRTREIGIRAALGSSRQALVRLFAIEGFSLVAAGVVLGLAGGAAATRLITFMLYGTSPLDAMAWIGAAGIMLVAGVAAAIIPALRAARVDPLVAIQVE